MRHAADRVGDRAARLRELAENLDREREVVWTKDPDRVDVVRVPPADAGAAQPDHETELTLARDSRERLDSRVIAPLVHHEEPLLAAEPGRVGGIRRQRLLDEDRHSARERLVADLRVGLRRHGHDDSLHLRELRRRRHDRGRSALARGRPARIGPCHDAHAAAQREEVPQDEPSPSSAADQADCNPLTHAREPNGPQPAK